MTVLLNCEEVLCSCVLEMFSFRDVPFYKEIQQSGKVLSWDIVGLIRNNEKKKAFS